MLDRFNRSTAVAAAVLTAVGLLAFTRHVVSDAHGMATPLLAFDPFGLYYPMLEYGFATLRAGRLPLWNPYQMAGQPFLATFYPGVLYPLNLLYLFVPVHVAMVVLTAAHVVLAGLAAALYARVALRVSIPAAIVAGVVFMTNTWTVWAFVAQNQLYSLPWVPLGFLAVDRAVATGRIAWAAAIGGALAMPILGGNLQTLSYEAYAIVPYVLACAWDWKRVSLGGVARAGRVVAVGVVLGAMLSAPQLLPTLELSNLSSRSVQGLTAAQIEPLGSLPLPTLRQFLDARREPLTFLYAGVVPLLFVPFAVLSPSRHARATALLLVAVLTGLVAHGFSNPVGSAYLHLPMGNWFRVPARAWGTTMFAVGALAALGLDVLLYAPYARGRALLLGSLVVVLASVLIAAAPRPAALCCAGAGLVLVAARGAMLNGQATRGVAAALVALVAVDFAISVPTNRTIVPFAAGEHHVLEILRQAIELAGAGRPGARTVHEALIFNAATTPKLGTLFRIPTFDDDEPFTPPRYRDWGLRMTGITVEPGNFYLGGWNLQASTFDSRFLDYAGVGGIVLLRYDARRPPPAVAGLAPPTKLVLPSPRALGANERLIPLAGNAYVFTNPYAWPRAFVAGEVHTAANGSEVLDALAALPRGAAPLALVEKGDISLDVPTDNGAQGEAVVLVSEPERVVVRASTDRPTMFVLLDTDLPGWTADVDGVGTPIVRTNYLFRGIVLPAGSHTVTFQYAPRSVRFGLLAAAVGLVGGIGLIARGARRSHAPRVIHSS